MGEVSKISHICSCVGEVRNIKPAGGEPEVLHVTVVFVKMLEITHITIVLEEALNIHKLQLWECREVKGSTNVKL